MRPKTILLFLMMIASGPVLAQQNMSLQAYLKAQGIQQEPGRMRQAKAAKIMSRLIRKYHGVSNATGSAIRHYDSTTYTYSLWHYGDLNSSHIEFDSMFYHIHAPSGTQYDLEDLETKHYNAEGLVDTMLHYEWENGAYRLSYREYYWYDAVGRDSLWYSNGWDGYNSRWTNFNRYLTSYSASGEIARIITQSWDYNNSVWQDQVDETRTYNGPGGIISEIRTKVSNGGSMVDSRRVTYTYDSNGNLISQVDDGWYVPVNVWAPITRYTYYYNTSDERIAQVFEYQNSGSMVKQDSTLFSTSGGTPMTQTITHYDWTLSGWMLAKRSTLTLSPTGMISTMLDEVWNGSAWVNNQRSFCFYNNYDQLTRLYTESWVNSAWGLKPNAVDHEYRYYYENVTGVSVPPWGFSSVYLLLRPVPAANCLSLSIPLDEPQHITVSVIDALGHQGLWYHARVRLGVYNADLDISHLPAGNYVLTIASEGGRVSKPFTIAR